MKSLDNDGEEGAEEEEDEFTTTPKAKKLDYCFSELPKILSDRDSRGSKAEEANEVSMVVRSSIEGAIGGVDFSS